MENELLLTDEEILEASHVNMFLPNGELDLDCGYLRGRQQVAEAQLSKVLKAGYVPFDKERSLFVTVCDNEHRLKTKDGYEQLLWSTWLSKLGLTSKGMSGYLTVIKEGIK